MPSTRHKMLLQSLFKTLLQRSPLHKPASFASIPASSFSTKRVIFSSNNGHIDYEKHLTQLGAKVAAPSNPEQASLETCPNPYTSDPYVIRFTCPEFTSLCPITSQPDFAHIVIDYVPRKLIVESKSLKLYLQSFRNHGSFHEACTVSIGKKLVDLLDPQFLRIGGYWYPRGGIPIDVFYQSGDVPKGVWLPDQGVPGYRGRG